MSLAQSGQTTAALERCKKLIKKHPRDVEYLLLAASVHAGKNEFAQILDYCKLAITLDPKNISALYNIGVAYLNLGDYENAHKYGNKLVSLDKKNAKALSNLALACWHLADFEHAVSNCLAAIKLEPGLATAHNNLGLAYKSLKNTDLALTHFKQAIQLDPRLVDAYYNCGITLLEMNDDNCHEYLKTVFKINPNYAELHNYNGIKFLQGGNTKDAIECFRKAIISKPQYTEAYINLGSSFMKENNFVGAEVMFRKAIEYQPTNAVAYANLGNALLEQDNFQLNYLEAEQCYIKAIQLAPELNDTYKYIAACYAWQGKTDAAIKYYELYNQKVPGDNFVVAAMISTLERKGDFDEGLRILTQELDNKNTDPNILLAYGKLAKHLKQEKEAMEAIQTIDDNTIKKELLTAKYHILGKLAQSQKLDDAAFNFFKKANELEDEIFDFSQAEKQFNDLKVYFTEKKIKTLNRSENNSTLPIFIIGMPRSGTTLTEQILSCHPDIFGAGELLHINQVTGRIGNELIPKNSLPASLDSMTKAYASKIATEHLNTLQAMSPESSKVVDKMPHNFISLGIINLLFPKATIIHCQRSSIDTCLSIYFQHFNKKHAYSNDLSMLGKYYNLYIDLMQHWRTVLDINIIDLKYENVIANPEEETRKLLEQCNISWDPACLNFHNNKRVVMTPSYDQVRQPIYKESVAKWKKYEHHLGELIDNLGENAN